LQKFPELYFSPYFNFPGITNRFFTKFMFLGIVFRSKNADRLGSIHPKMDDVSREKGVYFKRKFTPVCVDVTPLRLTRFHEEKNG